MGIITLTAAYGTRDYAGVLLSLTPQARIVDITYEVAPHDITQAAFVLRRSWSRFPEGTVHLAVVDPGVGRDRLVIVGRYAGRSVVGRTTAWSLLST